MSPIHRWSLLLSLLALLAVPPLLHADDDKVFPLVAPAPFSDEESDRVNASARGLAGLSASSDRGEAWESTDDWHSYRDWIDGRWNYLGRVRLNAMRAWSASEVGDLRSKPAVFYPFSGPDFLYVDALFPDSKYLLMAGLEPIGSMPDLGQLEKDDQLGAYLKQVKTSLYTILAASFFKTKDMKTDFNNGSVDGLIPAIVVFLAREGYTIDGIQYVELERDGTLSARSGKGDANGVQITYFRSDRGDVRTVCYFQCDLGNDGLRGNPGYTRLMHRLGPGVTYLKAASYLLYEDYFSSIRNAILEDSAGVVEDDSGVPLKYFNPAQWDVTPYGNYTGPIPLFKEHFQPDLAAYYSGRGHAALPFGSGYKFVASGSSLLVARKK